LIDYQLAENRSTEVTFGLDWRQKGSINQEIAIYEG
jgi:hypothetical protein